MREVAKLPVKDRTELFQAAAIKMGMLPNVVEKDFWVCFMLDHLFHDCQYKKAFVFKGGTSLSKSYHVIERFSEDIDLILDWRKIITDGGNPWSERSKTKQDQFNKQINAEAAKFYENEFVPKLNKELEKKLGDTVIFEGNKFSIEEVVDWIIKKRVVCLSIRIMQIHLMTWKRFCVLFCSFIAIKNIDSSCEGRLWDS